MLLRNGGAIVRENDSERGIGGYKFPRCHNGREEVEYTADVFAILPDGRPVIVEIDGSQSGQGHYSEHAVHRDQFRDAYFHRYGIITVRYFTAWVKDLTEAQLLADIDYQSRRLRKSLCATLKLTNAALTTN